MQPPAEGDPRQIQLQFDLLSCILLFSLEFNIINSNTFNSNTLVDHHVRRDIVINFKGNRETAVHPYTHRQLTLSKVFKCMVFACSSAKLKTSEGSPRCSPRENQ